MESVESVARQLIGRMREVYNPVYIAKCERDEPESLLGLCRRLEVELERAKGGER